VLAGQPVVPHDSGDEHSSGHGGECVVDVAGVGEDGVRLGQQTVHLGARCLIGGSDCPGHQTSADSGLGLDVAVELFSLVDAGEGGGGLRPAQG
jgi:hypothetical protein